ALNDTPKSYLQRAIERAYEARDKGQRAAQNAFRALIMWPLGVVQGWRAGWRKLKFNERLAHFLNFLLFAAAVAAVVFTMKQLTLGRKANGMTRQALKITRRSNRLTRDSNESTTESEQRQLRAYLTVMNLEYDGVVEARVRFRATLSNMGRTPALN